MNAAIDAMHKIHVVQGECQISDDPRVMFTTTLGSCISACMYDPEARVGGMNHFLLPHGDGVSGTSSMRYGAYAMELLVNQLLRAGATRRGLRAKLFGGARLNDGLADIGAKNSEFARAYLAREGVLYEGGSTLGRFARKVQFWPSTGRARQLELTRRPDDLVVVTTPPADLVARGDVELF